MPKNTYRIKIIKEGTEFEVEGDKALVTEMFNNFGKGSPTQPLIGKKGKSQIEGKPLPPQSKSTKPISVSEFIRSLEVKKHTDIVLAFGYYLEKYSGLTGFTPADINNCYYESKMESSNTSQMIIHNIRSSRMMESKGETGKKKKTYRLTRTGEGYIESKFVKEN